MNVWPITWEDSLPSTNARVRELLAARPGLPHGFALAAREQTGGVGRLGRRWVSAAGRDIALSVLLRPAGVEVAGFVSLPLALALGVVDLLTALGPAARTRWPNDVLVGRRKICGILCEQADTPAGPAVIAGIGLNVNMPAGVADRIDQPATSLAIETGRAHDVGRTAADLAGALARRYDRWVREGFAGLRDDWQRVSAGVGRPAIVQTAGRSLSGVLVGFGPYGELILHEATGAITSIWSADHVRIDAE